MANDAKILSSRDAGLIETIISGVARLPETPKAYEIEILSTGQRATGYGYNTTELGNNISTGRIVMHK